MNFPIKSYFQTIFVFGDKYIPLCLSFAICALFCVSCWLPFMQHDKPPWAHGIGFILLLENRKVLQEQIIRFLMYSFFVNPLINTNYPNHF